MAPSSACCHDPQSLVGAQSPFSNILALGFYDGPTSGVLRCAACRTDYRFDLLDWDEDQAVRIFRLARLPEGALEECVQALGQPEPPRWPVWMPSRWSLPSEGLRQEADRAVQQILDRAVPSELVLAWVGYGEQVLAARRVAAPELSAAPDWFSISDPTQIRNWFSLLGLAKVRGQEPLRTGE